MRLSYHWGALLVTACCVQLAASKEDPEVAATAVAEPPFPKLFPKFLEGGSRVKIVSEVLGDDVGYQTSEEYVDLQLGQAAFVVRKVDLSQQVAYTSTNSPVTYKYWPYVCKTLKPDEVVFANLDDFITHVSMKSAQEESNLRLFGVSALWLLIDGRPKSYSKSDLVFSASKDIYRPSHDWTAKIEDKDLLVTFSFIDDNAEALEKQEAAGEKKKTDDPSDELNLSLQMVQIKSLKTKKILRTMNILMIDYELDETVYNTLFQVPVGYGCPTAFSTGTGRFRSESESTLVELEVTKTSVDYDDKKQADVRTTKTVHIETYISKFTSTMFVSSLTRVRDEERDIKVVDRHRFNVRFVVNPKLGTCEIVHDTTTDNANQEELIYAFDGDLDELPLTSHMLDFLLHNRDNFNFIKRVPGNAMSAEHVYFERPVSWPIDLRVEASPNPTSGTQVKEGKAPATIIRNYLVASDNSESQLERVTIWVFDENRERIVKSYLFNVLGERLIDDYDHAPQLLDISEECYLNNPKMRPGRDYAWIQAFYPVSSLELEQLATNEAMLRRSFYSSVLTNPKIGIHSYSMPRVEILFNDEGFEVRALLLDIPPLEVIYEPFEGKSIKLNKEAGDLSDMAPDIQHCARLCRLHHCEAMTYCRTPRTCSLGLGLSQSATEPQQTPAQRYPLSPMANCKTLMAPFKFGSSYMVYEDLRHVLSFLRHEDYTTQAVPKAPEEIVLNREQTGIDQATYDKLMKDYSNELQLFFNSSILPALTLNIFLNERTVVLPPSKFVLEKDPLDSFNQFEHEAVDALDADDMKADAFHEGIALDKFKLSAFPDDLAKRARQYDGLTYDQCALACLDSKCGSFSYCSSRQECIITSVNSTRLSLDFNLIQPDVECSVYQRDFLKNFNQFPGVYRPQFSRKRVDAVAPSDCALDCVSESDFKCLSFQFCPAQGASKRGSCYYQEDRHPAGIYADSRKSLKKLPQNDEANACDHYERSLLADFNQIEYKSIAKEQMDKLKTSTYEGVSVFDCADMCVSQTSDCTAFQFCFGWQRASLFDGSQATLQECSLIRSKPNPEDLDNFNAVIDERADGKLVKVGKYFENNQACHLYTLRHDTTEAHLRDLAFSQTMTLAEQAELEAAQSGASSGLTFFGAFMLFVTVTGVSMALGFGVCVAKEHNEFLRQRIERGRMLLGI